MNLSSIQTNLNTNIPFLREAKNWIRKNPTACALTLLAGLTIAGLFISSSPAQPEKELVAKRLEVNPFESSSDTLRTPSSLELAATSPPSERSVVECLMVIQTQEEQIVRVLCAKPYTFYKLTKSVVVKSDTPQFLVQTALCSCLKLNAKSRTHLEKSALNLLTRSFKKDSPLTVVSVGPGGCYQEIVYLAKLADAGYTQINLVLIDSADISDRQNGLSDFCRNYIPRCRVQITKYDSLERYQEEAQNNNSLKPNLLLMLDLTDEEYNTNNKSLPDYAFQLFQKNKVLDHKTVICYSTDERQGPMSFPKTISCSYDGQSTKLSAIQSNRNERLVHPNGMLRIGTGAIIC